MQQTEDFLSRSPDAFFPEALVEEHLQEDEALRKALIANSSQVLGNRLQILEVLKPDAFIIVITFLHHSIEMWLLISTHMLDLYCFLKCTSTSSSYLWVHVLTVQGWRIRSIFCDRQECGLHWKRPLCPA